MTQAGSTGGAATAPRRPLGRTGHHVLPVGLGTWAIGGNMWGPQDDAESLATINRAIDLGVNFIDTALVYGNGHSERLLGTVLRERGLQGKVLVASKIPSQTMQWEPDPGTPMRDLFPAAWLRQCVEISLSNLGMDHVDVMQLHTWCPTWNDETEWWETLSELKRERKIGAIGISVSNSRPDEANDSIVAGRVETIQVVYNIRERRPERHLLPLAEQYGVGIIARVPLDYGALTGKWTYDTTFPSDDWRGSEFQGEGLRRAVDDAAKLAFLTEDGGSLAEAALRFVLSDPAVSVCIPGGRTPAQVEQNVAAAARGPLPASALARLDELWDHDFSEQVEE